MLYIQKNSVQQTILNKINEIKRSELWKKIPENDTKAIRAQFDLLPKEKIRQSLVEEQHGLCAYCMRRIQNSDKMSIEHWYPLSKSKNGALDYTNFLGVCDGGKLQQGGRRRILCCDASKGNEEELKINPQNRQHIEKIRYKRDGTIYIEPWDERLGKDINDILCLNGKQDAAGHRIADTSTELVKGRRDTYLNCEAFFRKLHKAGKCTSAIIGKKIYEIEHTEVLPEYAGVMLYVLKKKHRQLINRGL